MTHTLDEARSILKQFWQYDDFRPGIQTRAMETILGGGDAVVVMPTGGGKSILFQVPALLNETPVLVVSPLISLMGDQAIDCNRRGVPAIVLNSSMSDAEQASQMRLVAKGRYKVVYASPERIASNDFRDVAIDARFSMIAVDEAHCVSLHGHTYRPHYAHIAESVQRFGYRPQIVALTATCTERVKEDIGKVLKLKAPTYALSSPVRENVTFVRPRIDGSPWNTIKRACLNWNLDAGRYIVYVNSRKGCETMAAILKDTLEARYGMSAHGMVGVYHAGMDHTTSRYDHEDGRRTVKEGRTDTLKRFKAGTLRVVCATTAFGMGIDIPDIREVWNFGLPMTVEDFIQMAGRAGRDGLPSRSVLCVAATDVDRAEKMVGNKNPDLEYYESFWAWVRASYEHGESITDSIETITFRVNREPVELVRKIALPQMETILAVMQSRGYLKSLPSRNAMKIDADVQALRAELGGMSGSRRMVGDWLMQYYRTAQVNSVVVRSATIADQLALGQDMVKDVLMGMQRKGWLTVERGFDVPSYEILRDDDGIDDVTETLIESTRRAAIQRFEVMKEYARTGDFDVVLGHFVSEDS